MQRLLLVTALILCACGTACSTPWSKEAQRKREASYQAALGAYAEDLKPGLSRREVEQYFRAKNVSFRQICCIGYGERPAFDDLVQIGNERAPWYCSSHNVYVAFEFDAIEVRKPPEIHESDVLMNLKIYHLNEGCL